MEKSMEIFLVIWTIVFIIAIAAWIVAALYDAGAF